MSEQRSLLLETALAAFARAKTEGFGPIDEAGFAQLLVAEAKGGFGGDWGDVFAVIRVAGSLALDEPVGEKMVAAVLGRDFDASQDRQLGAFLRVAQSAGALETVLAMSVEHCNTRQQFGKPLAKQQAVQQNLALLAIEVAAVNVAGEAAAAALDRGDAAFEIAAAKLRTNQAITVATAIAHQVHGAIGFTQDYSLHHYTRRLMHWASEFGNEAHWAQVLGAQVCEWGGAGLWAELTRRTDAKAGPLPT
jgi:acyl-CoA dehydrogenase